MSKLEVVEGWKCTDGMVFTDIGEANFHQAGVDFDLRYDSEDCEFYAPRSGALEPKDVRDWLREYKDFVQQFYNAMEGK